MYGRQERRARGTALVSPASCRVGRTVSPSDSPRQAGAVSTGTHTGGADPMPRKPTGNPRGRPKGTGELDAPQRITVWLSGDLYRQLEAYAEGRHFHRGTPVLASCVRELLGRALACPYKQQTENVPVPEQEMVSLPIADLPALPALSLADRGLLPDCPAVYFVLDETCTVLYVGYTASLRTRWKSHHRLESF